MKKILIILGGLFLVGLAVLGILIGFAAYNGEKLDASSKAYVESTLPKIVSPWSSAELQSQASKKFTDSVNQEQLDQLFRKLSELGANQSIGEPKGDSMMAYTSQTGKQITAKYLVPCTFENGDAEVKITLIMEEDRWQILGFHVDSPVFLK